MNKALNLFSVSFQLVEINLNVIVLGFAVFVVELGGREARWVGQ